MPLEQKLHLKLAQKLILTPSLQQAIKLLPMATLELVDLLNQEVVENPLLEEVTAEELQQADAVAQVDTADPDPQPTTDTPGHVGRRRLRLFLWRVSRHRLSAADAP